MIRRLFFSILFSMMSLAGFCQVEDSLDLRSEVKQMEAVNEQPTTETPKNNVWKEKWEKIYEVIKDFSRVDKRYIEPQQYNYTVMLQNTNTIESYTLSNKNGEEVVFAPKPSFKVGPYVGWRWLVLGYTIDFTHLGDGHNKQGFDFSLYSNQIGFDIFFRNSGNDYRVRSMTLGEGIDTRAMKNVSFDGLKSKVQGFNIYYIVNHKRFSYPAAFSQSTRQLISQGSPLAGFGYMRHNLKIDADRLGELVKERLGSEVEGIHLEDSTLHGANVHYTDFSLSGGYGYNWVFAPQWLFAASLSVAVAYKQATGDLRRETSLFRDFSFRNLNLDGVGRFGVVWNNGRWYAGTSAIFHTYNYKKSQFSTNSTFGNLNIYVGINFGNR